MSYERVNGGCGKFFQSVVNVDGFSLTVQHMRLQLLADFNAVR